MRLLDRYLLRELLVPLTYCLVGFQIFWVAFNLLSELNKIRKAGLGPLEVLQYIAATIPELLMVALPIALLLALLYTLANHARHNEITAMKAAGISLWRISVPYLAVGTILSLVLFGISEWWMIHSQEKAQEVLKRHLPATTNSFGAGTVQLFFRNEIDNRNWTAPGYNPKTSELFDPIIIWETVDGTRQEIYAQKGVFTNDVWIFYQVVQALKSKDARSRIHTNELAMPEFMETPAMIRSELRINSLKNMDAAKRAQLSVRDILIYLKLHPRLPPEKLAMLKTQLHGRFAMPWACLTVVLVALPFAARSGRRNVFVGVASSIFICFIYFILQRLGLTLGTGGHLPAWLAAWLPNFVFASIGIILTSRTS